MPKPINLGTPALNFPNITAAKAYFDLFRTDGKLDHDVPAQQFEQLKLLYEKYCDLTKFPLPARVIAFFPTMEKRSTGYTRCLAARFADGSKTTFSLDKALSAVATDDRK